MPLMLSSNSFIIYSEYKLNNIGESTRSVLSKKIRRVRSNSINKLIDTIWLGYGYVRIRWLISYISVD